MLGCFISILVVVFCFPNFIYSANETISNRERSIVIVIASYNNKNWYKKNLDSIFVQRYKNYRIIYIDDNSPDGTGKLVEKYILEKRQTLHTTLICNEKRQGALANLYYAIHSCNDRDIIVTLDGDDWFAHDRVLKIINEVYTDSNVWLTYGQFKIYPEGNQGFCSPIPQNILQRREFRKVKWCISHLRTFYAGLFKKIKIEDLLYEGKFFSVSWDRAIMFPMIEMAHNHFKFIPDILYIYNNANPINDHKTSRQMQLQLAEYIQNLPPYNEINSPF
jgi:glycosyltransferase involved in cell wall biosynthesis